MQKHKLMLSSFTNTNMKEKNMNKTLNSFSTSQKFKNIPLLTSIQCQPSDYEFKFNKTNYKNRIESIKNNSFKKIKQKPVFNNDQVTNKQIINSLKRYNLEVNKNSNNVMNILQFNEPISATMNSYFHGKKILMSNHPLLSRNKFISNNKKNIEINSSLFGDKFNHNDIYNNIDGKLINKIIYNSGDFFSTKIERDLKDIYSKTNTYKTNNNYNNNFENSKQIYGNKNKYFTPLINSNNKANIQNLHTEGDLILKKNKMKLVKKINSNDNKSKFNIYNNPTKTLVIHKSDINYNNKYISPRDMVRKVVFVGQNNNTISNNKTLNLLKEEKDYIDYNLNSMLIDYYFDEKGNKVKINLNNKKGKFNNGKFLTEFGNKELESLEENSKDYNNNGKLGQLIKDRFTMKNYRNISPSRMNSGLIEYNYYNKNNPDDYNDNLNNNNNIKNYLHNHCENIYSNNIFRKIISNSNNNISTSKRRNKEKNKNNMLTDLLGVIKSKVIETPIKKPKKIGIQKKEVKSKNKDNNKNNDSNNLIKRKYSRSMSRMENSIIDFYLSNKYFGEENKINSSLLIKDSKGNTTKINFKQKGNDLLTPINEEGEEIKDMRVLNNIYGLTKQQLNLIAEKNLFQKRYSFDIIANFKNPINLKDEKEKENENENSRNKTKKKQEKFDNNKNNINILNKILNEEKEKLAKKEKGNNKKLISNLQKIEKKVQKPVSKTINIKSKSVLKKSIYKKSQPKKDISPNKNAITNINNNDILQSKINIEPEITDPKVKELLNDIKNNPQNEIINYNEEEDFIKDFNFDFYSSDEESAVVSFQKKMRNIRKKKNKHLFSIFNFIAKNTNFSHEFTKTDLIKYLLNDEFRYNFEQLKEQIAKGRILSYNSIHINGMGPDKKLIIKDLEIINYLFRYVSDKDSIFYRAMYHPKKRKNIYGDIRDISNGKLSLILDQNKEELKKKKRFSVLYRRESKNFLEDKSLKKKKKKFEKKKKAQSSENDLITQSEKKLIMLNEINLTNELKYQISISNDKESRQKFANLLNEIESLRNLDSNQYIKMLKKNFEMYKEELNEFIKAKEIEERLNGFLDSLNYQRNNLKDKHKYIMSLLLIKDNKFLTTLEKND